MLFLNNKKIPCIPPIFYEKSFMTDFKEKAELLNSFLLRSVQLQIAVEKFHVLYVSKMIICINYQVYWKKYQKSSTKFRLK